MDADGFRCGFAYPHGESQVSSRCGCGCGFGCGFGFCCGSARHRRQPFDACPPRPLERCLVGPAAILRISGSTLSAPPLMQINARAASICSVLTLIVRGTAVSVLVAVSAAHRSPLRMRRSPVFR